MEPILEWADDLPYEYADGLSYEPSPHRSSYKSPGWVDDLTDRADQESDA